MLTQEQVNRIAVEFLKGQTPTIKGAEADALREQLKKDVEAIRKKGYVVELPFEWQDPKGK